MLSCTSTALRLPTVIERREDLHAVPHCLNSTSRSVSIASLRGDASILGQGRKLLTHLQPGSFCNSFWNRTKLVVSLRCHPRRGLRCIEALLNESLVLTLLLRRSEVSACLPCVLAAPGPPKHPSVCPGLCVLSYLFSMWFSQELEAIMLEPIRKINMDSVKDRLRGVRPTGPPL